MLESGLETRFCQARRAAIALDYRNLNGEQQRAVLATEGPLLLLAGAGSGKTTVLIHRVANLMKYGRGSDSDEVLEDVTADDLAFLEGYVATKGADDKARALKLCRLEPAAPWSIIAITFTNKAAGELKERLEKMLGTAARDIWAATFHSACVRILRRDIEKLGLPSSFTIYDTDDSLRVIKDVIKAQSVDDKAFPPRSILGYISRAKDEMKLAPDFLRECKQSGDIRMTIIGQIYVEYQKRLWDSGALDFDDIILHTVRLLQEHEDVRSFYQNKFRYVLIDEYQDTNHLQYLLASLLAGKWENICVVGDDDQSIYRFRGATIENIMSFEKQYKGARVIRLEQNYRSTKTILEASNAVIRNNEGRKGKELWTENVDGDKIRCYTAMNEQDEAQFVAIQILEDFRNHIPWKDHAILYRMNAQSNQMEIACKRNGIPYRIIGGTRFFERAEVKDMVSYLCAIHNPDDDLRLSRIINVPTRGIGATTIDKAKELAAGQGTTLWNVVDSAANYPELQKAAPKLQKFAAMMRNLRDLSVTMELPAFYEELVAQTGYETALLLKNTIEDRTRLENVKELSTSITGYVENAEGEPTLAGFLDEIALYTDLDSQSADDDCVVMMTMHSAKGLEFPTVFVVGAEEGIFPGMRSIGEAEEMEEERRLCYVAMTRAKKRLFMTCAAQRMLFGRTSNNRPSRFVEEIPADYTEKSGRSFLSENREPEGGWQDIPMGYRKPISGGNYQTPGRNHGYSLGSSGESGAGAPRTNTGTKTGTKTGTRPGFAAASGVTKAAPLPDFGKGDMILHKAFGRGMVLSLQKMGTDALIEIAFDNIGTKRLMLKSAAQHMEKEQH